MTVRFQKDFDLLFHMFTQQVSLSMCCAPGVCSLGVFSSLTVQGSSGLPETDVIGTLWHGDIKYGKKLWRMFELKKPLLQ